MKVKPSTLNVYKKRYIEINGDKWRYVEINGDWESEN